jgi:hypothetical protein
LTSDLDLEGTQIPKAGGEAAGHPRSSAPGAGATNAVFSSSDTQRIPIAATHYGDPEEQALTLPTWSALLVGCVNVLLMGCLWWRLKPAAAPSVLPDVLAELTELLSATPEPA